MEERDEIFEQLLAETRSRLRRTLSTRTIPPSEVDYMLNVMENDMRRIKIEMEVRPPKKSPSLNTITVTKEGRVVGYHWINGNKVQIVQAKDKAGKMHWYTNGIEEIVPDNV